MIIANLVQIEGLSVKESLILWGCCLLFVGTIIAVIGYFIARFLKGRIRINLQHDAVSPGDEICGTIEVQLRKAAQVERLLVTLTGESLVKSSSIGSSNETRTRWSDFHNEDIILLENKELGSGSRSMYEFSLQVPRDAPPSGAVRGKGRFTPFGSYQRRTRVRWTIKTRLEVPGVDLASSTKIRVTSG